MSETSPTTGTILITGANGGLGTAIVSEILKSHSEFYGLYAVRNPNTAARLQHCLESAPSTHRHEIITLHLDNLDQIRDTAVTINRRVAESSLPPIRALVLNAAFREYSTQAFTADRFDMTFMVNYLANFLLVHLLLPSLDKRHGRIVIVSSWMHDYRDRRNRGIFSQEHLPEDIDVLAGRTLPSLSNSSQRYGASKLCMILFMYQLQRRLQQDPVLSDVGVLAVDPGAMATDIARHGARATRIFMKSILPLLAPLSVRLSPNGMLRTPSKSAKDILFAAFEEKTLSKHPRAVYLDGSRRAEPSIEAKDSEKQKRLWHASLRYVQLTATDTALANWQ